MHQFITFATLSLILGTTSHAQLFDLCSSTDCDAECTYYRQPCGSNDEQCYYRFGDSKCMVCTSFGGLGIKCLSDFICAPGKVCVSEYQNPDEGQAGTCFRRA
ncbi:hypothetical protein FisN_UnNu035 [Fistulifera solaris]|uniref:Uncharacterized protein n=1 Tax=Fistulifera solaris TaxID=1519565 RepID=A0A1Z5JF85_FISSO|nr:hypothetical protein FisN_UnNu035 [Fistulifera solaris]|eukprot:GAX12677.1 hypothetical protein FisN_UnNu035 [Fistulifera solaris]